MLCIPRRGLATLGSAVLILSACTSDPSGPGDPDPLSLAGGATTVFDASAGAFSHPAPNLSGSHLAEHQEGRTGFDAEFTANPSAPMGGLGPLFNAHSCVACHPGAGRGIPPLPGEEPVALFLKLGTDGANPDGTGSPAPAAGFGIQLQTRAIPGVDVEATILVGQDDYPLEYADGTTHGRRLLLFTITAEYAPLPSGLQISPRNAPPIFGMGLLEAVAESDILALADEGDLDGDGISGRPNFVWDYESGSVRLGRFGWKAGNPTLLQQVAGAFAEDMGITNPLFPVENSAGQPQDDGNADDPEIDQEFLDLVTLFSRTLAVPAPRDIGAPTVERGRVVFSQIGCASCHVPQLTTGTLPGLPEVSGQTIFPYTDLLLHDMGIELSDGRPEFQATTSEWRTPPLWGIGLTLTVNGHEHLLHDGRARDIAESILWHGGEAQVSKESFQELSTVDRLALLAFLASL